MKVGSTGGMYRDEGRLFHGYERKYFNHFLTSNQLELWRRHRCSQNWRKRHGASRSEIETRRVHVTETRPKFNHDVNLQFQPEPLVVSCLVCVSHKNRELITAQDWHHCYSCIPLHSNTNRLVVDCSGRCGWNHAKLPYEESLILRKTKPKDYQC